MGDLLKFTARERPPSWGGTVSVEPADGGGVQASMATFYGDDGMETPDRLLAWAAALRTLANTMDATAAAILQEPKTDDR